MNVATVRFYSPALARHTTYSVILPVTGDGPFPVVLQLHGYSDDHTSWLYSSNLVRHAAPYPMIVVLPDGATSGYLNLPHGPHPTSRIGIQRYEDLMVDDLRQQIERIFQVRPGPWAIGGLSMGGFGAMRLGLKYPGALRLDLGPLRFVSHPRRTRFALPRPRRSERLRPRRPRRRVRPLPGHHL